MNHPRVFLRIHLQALALALTVCMSVAACYSQPGVTQAPPQNAVPVVATRADGDLAAHQALYAGGEIPIGACFNGGDLLLPAVTASEWDARIKAAGGTGRSIQGGVAGGISDLSTLRNGRAIAMTENQAWVYVATNEKPVVETYLVEKSASGVSVWRLVETLERC